MRTWYLGPPGDLRALDCPEVGIDLTTERLGGVHQGLSGARTVDVTGHRDTYQFRWNWMLEEDWKWLQALHTRHIRGPFWLINPMRKNRLSTRAASLFKPHRTNDGVGFNSGDMSYSYEDWPSEADPGNRSLKWFSRPSGLQYLTFDRDIRAPVFVGEEITGSVYLRASASLDVELELSWFDSQGVQIIPNDTNLGSVTTEWQRFSVTGSAPTTANTITNPDFESDTVGWFNFGGVLSHSTGQAHSGTGSGLATPDGTSSTGVYGIDSASAPTVTVGTEYRWTVWLYSPNGWSNFRPVIRWLDSGGSEVSQTEGLDVTIEAGVWTRLLVTGTAPESAVSASPRVWQRNTPSAGDTFHLDDARLRRPLPATTARLTVLPQDEEPDLFLAAPQVESGASATAWEQGGGAVLVHIDQMTSTSPLYPFRNTSLTLLEA